MIKPSNPTPMIKPSEAGAKWYIVDATDQPVGRLASKIAAVVRGKNKPTFTPHWDMGDFVVVTNVEKIQFTGRKWEQKRYYTHSMYPGQLKEKTAAMVRDKHPERILEAAVWGMLPKNRLGRKLYKKVKIYAGGDHPHAAQNPEQLKLA